MTTNAIRQSLTFENCQNDEDFKFFLKCVQQDIWLRCDGEFKVDARWITESILDTYKNNGTEADACKTVVGKVLGLDKIKKVQPPSYEYWDSQMREGNKTLWAHLHSMERGDKGGFAQRMFAALDKADLNNRLRLYKAFPELFNPRGVSY